MYCKTPQTTHGMLTSDMKSSLGKILKVASHTICSLNPYYKSFFIYWHYRKDLCIQRTDHAVSLLSVGNKEQEIKIRKANDFQKGKNIIGR